MKLLLFFFVFSIASITNAQAQQLKKYQWKNRIIILESVSIENTNFQKQLKALDAHHKGIKERKIIVIQSINQTFEIKPKNRFQIRLIGLDGSIKMESNNFIPVTNIFNTIDAMPMRQTELR